jgi:hypothetical protein
VRAWRFGHVECGALIHPLLYEAAGRALGVRGEDVGRVARGELALDDGVVRPLGRRASMIAASPTAITRALRARGIAPGNALYDAVVVQRAPVPPISERPVVEPLTPAQKQAWLGPVNIAWQRLARATIDADDNAAQRALEQAVAWTLAPPTVPDRPLWRAREPSAAPVSALADVAAADALLFVDERTLAIQRGRTVAIYDVTAATLSAPLQQFHAPRGRMFAVHGRSLAFSPPAAGYGAHNGLALYDLDEGAVVRRWPREIVRVAAARGVVVDEHVELELAVDGRLGPWTRDGRYLCVTDALATEIIDAEVGVPQLVIRADARPGFRAVGLTDDFAWRVIRRDGALTDGNNLLAMLDPAPAYALGPGCRLVAALADDEVTVSNAHGDPKLRFRIV